MESTKGLTALGIKAVTASPDPRGWRNGVLFSIGERRTRTGREGIDGRHLFFFIYFWLCWVFVSARGLSLVGASGGHSSSRCTGLSLSRPLLLRSTGSRRAGSVVVAHGPSCSTACGIFPDQGSNPCPLHCQADSQPLCHQGSPTSSLYIHLSMDI